jgi:hypothetical protein
MVLRTGQCGRFDVIQLVDLIEFIVKNVVELRVLQNVMTFIVQPGLPFLHLPRSLLLVHPRPVLVLVVFLYNRHCFGGRLLTPPRKTASCGLFKGIELSHFLLETTVVLLELPQLAAQGVLLLSGALVDSLDKEIVVQSQSRLRHRETLNQETPTCGTWNKSLYLLKKSIDYRWESEYSRKGGGNTFFASFDNLKFWPCF